MVPVFLNKQGILALDLPLLEHSFQKVAIVEIKLSRPVRSVVLGLPDIKSLLSEDGVPQRAVHLFVVFDRKCKRFWMGGGFTLCGEESVEIFDGFGSFGREEDLFVEGGGG